MVFSHTERFAIIEPKGTSGTEAVVVGAEVAVTVGILRVGITKNVAVGIDVKVGLGVAFGTNVGVDALICRTDD